MDRMQIHTPIDSNKKNYLVNLINDLLDFVRSQGPDSTYHNDLRDFIKLYCTKDFNNFVKSFSEALPYGYITQSIIETECVNFLGGLIQRDMQENENIGKELESLQERLENMVREWHAMIPINHLKLENLDRIKIGNVWLIPFDDLNDKIEVGLSLMNEANRSRIEKDVISKFKNKVCACISITTADNNMLYDEALKEIENVINLLRVYLSLFADSDIVKIDINESWVPPLFQFCLRQDKHEVLLAGRASTFNVDFVITEERRKLLETKYHLKDFEAILSKEHKNRSLYEEQMLTAIRWIGMGIHDNIKTDKFIKLFTALECLLIVKGEPKQEKLAERCAYILENVQKNRINKYNKVRNLYTKRGNIVHNGSEDITNEEIKELLELVRSCLFKMPDLPIYAEMKEKAALINWIDSQKFK